MKLLLEKTRVYGYGCGPCYRASVDGVVLGVAKTKGVAEDNAIMDLYSAYAVAGNPPAMARLADGRILIGTEVNRETFALFYFDPTGSRTQCVSFGSREINGRAVPLPEYVRYNALMADGMDCHEAARVATA